MTEEVASETSADWYIVHTYSGQEDRVKRNLEMRIESMDVKDTVFQVVIPTEDEIEIKEGQRKHVQRKIFPGYILVQMNMNDQSWYVVRNTPGVTGFVSAEDERERRPKPVALDPREVESIMNRMYSPDAKVIVGLVVGDMVRITGGPFAEFMGAIDAVDEDKGKIRVLVSFFGRETPVELDFLQVEKA